MAFTLLFIILTSIGRVPLGNVAAFASRYVTLMIPGLFGIGLLLQNLSSLYPNKYYLISVQVLLKDVEGIFWYSQGKSSWKDAYLKTSSVVVADRIAKFQAYPVPAGTHMDEKLQYMRERRLNIFNDLVD
jgi:hypothetical protein